MVSLSFAPLTRSFMEKSNLYLKGDVQMNINKETLKAKAKAFRDKVVKDFNAAALFVMDNPETTAALCGLGVAGYKYAQARERTKGEQKHKERSIWDASTGQWYLTNRPMTNAQKSEFARRKANGERTDQILISMRLL